MRHGMTRSLVWGLLAVLGGAALADDAAEPPPLHDLVAKLAADIRTTRDESLSQAQPIPQAIRERLAATGMFSSSTLDRARYLVGDADIVLPKLLMKPGDHLGDEWGVTIDDVIVFTRDPADEAEALAWWAHALRHVAQFEEWGVDRFALQYLDWLTVERDADDYAKWVLAYDDSARPAVAEASASAEAGKICKLPGQPDRRVAISYAVSEQPVPCSVDYYRADAEPEELFHAEHQSGYCEKSALWFTDKLRSQGWSCG